MLCSVRPWFVLLVAWTYCTLFITLGSSDFQFFDTSVGSGDDDTCTACPVGRYADNRTGDCGCNCTCPPPPKATPPTPCNCSGYCHDNSSCKECDYGHHNNKTGSPNCVKCEAGFFANTTMAINCTACPKGTTSNGTGQVNCINCPFGEYSAEKGSPHCFKCQEGQFCNATGPDGRGCVSCQQCPVGFVAPYKGTVNCTACRLGKYMPRRGGTTCMSCDMNKGLICSNPDFCAGCRHCDAGQEPSSPYSCVPCEAGMHSNSSTSFTCQQCPPGWYQSNQGMSQCHLCPAGYFCRYPSSEPMKCKEGLYCPNGTVEPYDCDSVFIQYTGGSCRPTAALYGIVACAVLMTLLSIALVAVVVYWTYCRDKTPKVLSEDKVPLFPKEPVKNPQYGGL